MLKTNIDTERSLYHYYQLVKPYESDKIIKTKSLKKAAKYFLKDVRRHKPLSTDFSIVDLNMNVEYFFKYEPSDS